MPKNFQGLFFFVPVLESHIDPSHHGWITFRAYLLDYQSLGGSERGLVLHSIVIGILALSDSAFRVVIIMTFQLTPFLLTFSLSQIMSKTRQAGDRFQGQCMNCFFLCFFCVVPSIEATSFLITFFSLYFFIQCRHSYTVVFSMSPYFNLLVLGFSQVQQLLANCSLGLSRVDAQIVRQLKKFY